MAADGARSGGASAQPGAQPGTPPGPTARAAAEATAGARLNEVVRRELVWLILAAMAGLLALALPTFATAGNLVNVASQVAIIGLLAVGVTLVLVAGHFDLSVGATLTLAAVLAIKMQPVDASGVALAILVPLAVGLAIGVLNGVLVGWLKANSIIVTVGMQFTVTGITLLAVAGQHVRVDNAAAAFVALGQARFLGVPVAVLVLAAAVIAGHVLLTHHLFGRHLKASGANATAAGLLGVPVARSVTIAYATTGVLAALAGIIVAARVRNLDPTAGAGYELAALTAVVLGGARLTGGSGNVLHTLAGVLILGVTANAMRLLDYSYNLQQLLQGLVLVAAVAIDAKVRRER